MISVRQATQGMLPLVLLALLAGCAGQGPDVSSKIRGDRAFEKGDAMEAVEQYRNYLESGLEGRFIQSIKAYLPS